MDVKIGGSLMRNKIATYSQSINCKTINTLIKKTKLRPPNGKNQLSDICFIQCTKWMPHHLSSIPAEPESNQEQK